MTIVTVDDEEMVAYLAKVAGLGIDVSGQAQDVLAKYGFNPAEPRAGGEWTTGGGDRVRTQVSATPQRQNAQRQARDAKASADAAVQIGQAQGRLASGPKVGQASAAQAEAAARKDLGIPTGKALAGLPPARQQAAQSVLSGVRDAVRNKNTVDREQALITQLQSELSRSGVQAKTGTYLTGQLQKAQARLTAAQQGLAAAQAKIAAGRKAWKASRKLTVPMLTKAVTHNWKHGWIWVGSGPDPRMSEQVHEHVAFHHHAMAEGRFSDAVQHLQHAASAAHTGGHDDLAASLDRAGSAIEHGGVTGRGRLSVSDRAFHEHAALAHSAAASGNWRSAFHHQAAAHLGHPGTVKPKAPRVAKPLPDGTEDAKRLREAKTLGEALDIVGGLKGPRLTAVERAMGMGPSGMDVGTRRNDLAHAVMAVRGRTQRDTEYRMRHAAHNRALGLSNDATPEQVHTALTHLPASLSAARIRSRLLDMPRGERSAFLSQHLSTLNLTDARKLARQLTGSTRFGRSNHQMIVDGVLQHFNTDPPEGRVHFPKADAPVAGATRAAVSESVPLRGDPEGDNMRMHGDSLTMGLAQAYARVGRNGSANSMMDLRRRATISGADGISPQRVVDELRAWRAQEQDPAFQHRIDQAIEGIDAPMTPLPRIPANTPPHARQLIKDLHAIPYARKGDRARSGSGHVRGPALVDQLAEVYRDAAAGRRGEDGRPPADRVRSILRERTHEINEAAFRIWDLSRRLDTQDHGGGVLPLMVGVEQPQVPVGGRLASPLVQELRQWERDARASGNR